MVDLLRTMDNASCYVSNLVKQIVHKMTSVRDEFKTQYTRCRNRITVHLNAVSYTHLDVYKRQLLKALPGMMSPSSQLGAVSVSYTHLDVYKRQIQGCMQNII